MITSYVQQNRVPINNNIPNDSDYPMSNKQGIWKNKKGYTGGNTVSSDACVYNNDYNIYRINCKDGTNGDPPDGITEQQGGFRCSLPHQCNPGAPPSIASSANCCSDGSTPILAEGGGPQWCDPPNNNKVKCAVSGTTRTGNATGHIGWEGDGPQNSGLYRGILSNPGLESKELGSGPGTGNWSSAHINWAPCKSWDTSSAYGTEGGAASGVLWNNKAQGGHHTTGWWGTSPDWSWYKADGNMCGISGSLLSTDQNNFTDDFGGTALFLPQYIGLNPYVCISEDQNRTNYGDGEYKSYSTVKTPLGSVGFNSNDEAIIGGNLKQVDWATSPVKQPGMASQSGSPLKPVGSWGTGKSINTNGMVKCKYSIPEDKKAAQDMLDMWMEIYAPEAKIVEPPSSLKLGDSPNADAYKQLAAKACEPCSSAYNGSSCDTYCLGDDKLQDTSITDKKNDEKHINMFLVIFLIFISTILFIVGVKNKKYKAYFMFTAVILYILTIILVVRK